MPVHDWTRVGPGVFLDFHSVWIALLRNALNQGILPTAYYARAEQVATDIGPDVITLHTEPENGKTGPIPNGGIAVATTPPRVRFSMRSEREHYLQKQKHLAIRHSSDDRVIALLEIVSPGNKDSTAHFERLTAKVQQAMFDGIHLVLIDLFPPTLRDPLGMHAIVWDYLCGEEFLPPGDKCLTLASYDAGPVKQAYVEPIAVGDSLVDMPLFLAPGWYVPAPLRSTYQSAWDGMPQKYKRVLESN